VVLLPVTSVSQGIIMDPKRSPRISAIICTYRNPDLLEGAIGSLLNQRLSPEEYEIIVVDNNSGDQTPGVVQRFSRGPLPPVRYILEPQQGLSHARNRGVEAARSDIVAFIDDDAEADSGWLSALLEAYESNPDIWAAGGRISPIWHTDERPTWWTEEYEGSLSLLDWGDEARVLTWPERMLGTNCSFRKSVFQDLGYFDPALGRRGTALLGHEETEIQHRMHLKNKLVFYTPAALVRHHVPLERLTEGYFLRRQYGASRSQMVVMLKQEGYAKAITRAAVDCLAIVRRLLIIAGRFVRTRGEIAFVDRRMLFHYWGHLVGLAEGALGDRFR
jgi:glycosyltransferase involved in cell wall biosynthesis